MPTSPIARPTIPPTVWPTRGRHVGPDAEGVLRHTLRQLKDSHVIDDFLEVPDAGDDPPNRVFEARWRVPDDVTVRARLSLAPDLGGGREWTLLAEAEQPWDPAWPSPVTRFWPEYGDWDHDAATGLSLSRVNTLPEDDKDARRLLRDSGHDGWCVHVVVHEAMTTDERGRLPLARWLPPSLRHRVVEHRAAPHQLRVMNWALREFDVEVPRGGAVVLPGTPAPSGYDAEDFAVRTVFLDGSEPADLVAAVTRFAALPRPLPDGAEEALTALREDWHLLTLEEELAKQRKLVAMYAEALEAMTKSRDLYREATERAHEALAAYRESAEAVPAGQQPSGTRTSPFQQLTRTLERLKDSTKALRPAATAQGKEDPDAEPTGPER
ncbi:hypothetical protein PV416_01250 [Streptomyces ipomoeae]|uniref:hypothetical protein n=1 Tax=Streptomyces ipomoeae TaxID=103232 RepID=UPI0015F0A00E|nr:hypothetical protein [Streptomyces ipomoeae]MDX2819740.1 hypothetical protein [Streptomyces ipomoeae]MDX2874708.1 hypothetical protein [Streptomyces ipomoeae]